MLVSLYLCVGHGYVAILTTLAVANMATVVAMVTTAVLMATAAAMATIWAATAAMTSAAIMVAVAPLTHCQHEMDKDKELGWIWEMGGGGADAVDGWARARSKKMLTTVR